MNRRTFGKLAGLTFANAMASPSGAAVEARNSPSTEATADPAYAWNRYFMGTAYYPEWWPEREWETDFREMQDLGINTVRMGEFAWAIYEPAPGKFAFSWMDRAIALANRHGISVILGTPTASVPPWLCQLYPDVLSGNSRGPYTYGGRKGYCPNSPAYQEACIRIVSALAEHYGHHPGVIGWQLDNEPGYPFELFDPVSKRTFQEWLRQRYGTLDALNRAWNGAFWSNEYSDWAQIDFPTNSAEGGWQPAISLDYRLFFSDCFLGHLRRQAAILRKKSRGQFIYTNWPSATWSVDIFKATEFLTATAWDNYVSAPGVSRFQHQYIAGLNHDMSRCAGPDQHFFCAEQIACLPPNAMAEGLRLQAYMNLAHGSYGQLYFEWRRPLAGNEQYRPSFVKQFNGAITPQEPVFRRISEEFSRLGPRLAGARTDSDIALLYDFRNELAEGFGSLGPRNERYDGQIMQYYIGLKVLQRNIDVVPLSADFSRYKVIAAAGLRLVDDSTAQRLHHFAANGGTLVLNYRAGTQHRNVSMRRVVPPGVFTDMAGVSVDGTLDLSEYNPSNGAITKELFAELGIVFPGAATVYRPRAIMESLSLHGAQAIAEFRGGIMTGHPAITRSRYGRGWVFYVGADSDDDGFYESLARMVGGTAHLQPLLTAPYGVEVVSREDAETTYYFLLNLTDKPQPKIALPAPMHDVIAGHAGVTEATLEPLGVAVLASRNSGAASTAPGASI